MSSIASAEKSAPLVKEPKVILDPTDPKTLEKMRRSGPQIFCEVTQEPGTIATCCGSRIITKDWKWLAHNVDILGRSSTHRSMGLAAGPDIYITQDKAWLFLGLGHSTEDWSTTMFPELSKKEETHIFEFQDKDLGPCVISWIDK